MKLQLGKFGLTHDPRGAHVTLTLAGRDLIGEVIAARYDEVAGCIRLTVRHFNGEPWPIEPTALAVNVLERR